MEKMGVGIGVLFMRVGVEMEFMALEAMGRISVNHASASGTVPTHTAIASHCSSPSLPSPLPYRHPEI
jgi:hypothetical protein